MAKVVVPKEKAPTSNSKINNKLFLRRKIKLGFFKLKILRL